MLHPRTESQRPPLHNSDHMQCDSVRVLVTERWARSSSVDYRDGSLLRLMDHVDSEEKRCTVLQSRSMKMPDKRRLFLSSIEIKLP